MIIAGAGGAAHLPGMVAALTSLPVVGVPVKTSTLNGNDSLLSIVQMPKVRRDEYSIVPLYLSGICVCSLSEYAGGRMKQCCQCCRCCRCYW